MKIIFLLVIFYSSNRVDRLVLKVTKMKSFSLIWFSLLHLLVQSQEIEKAASQLIADFIYEKLLKVDILNYADNFDMNFFLGSFFKSGLSAKVWNKNFISKNNGRKIKFGVMLFDNGENFVEVFNSFEISSFDIHGFYVIAIADSHKNVDKSLIFKTVWSRSLYNVNLLTKIADGSVECSTFHPFTPHQCQSMRPLHLSLFSNNSWNTKNLFPSKLKNFFKCPLKVGLSASSFQEVKYDNGTVDYLGADEAILKSLAAALNFVPHYDFNPVPFSHGTVLPNGSSSGVLSQVRSLIEIVNNLKSSIFLSRS